MYELRTATLKRHAANLVTVSRLVLLIPWIIFYNNSCFWMVPVMFVIILSDLIDGRIARLLETASPQGGLLDAVCDFIVVLVAMLVMGIADPFCLAVAVVIVLSLFTWVLRCFIENCLSYSRFGRYNGAACYAFMTIVGFISLYFRAHPWYVTILETVLFIFLITLLVMSCIENCIAVLRLRNRKRIF